MKQGIKKAGRRLLTLVTLALLGGLLSATLVRFAPGYGVDERELDPRLSQESLEAIRHSNQLSSGILSYYRRYLTGIARGDFGESQWLQRPVASLIKERLPVTARAVVCGVAVAWAAALAICVAGLLLQGTLFDISSTLLSALLVALPAGVVAMLAVYLRAPVFAAIAAVTFPKVYRYLRNLLNHAYAQPCVIAARARGVGSVRVLFGHVVPLASPAIRALAGVSLSVGFGAAIPIEALCDSPGVGQLAWQAALNRDLPLVMNVTLLITLLTVAANSLASTPLEKA